MDGVVVRLKDAPSLRRGDVQARPSGPGPGDGLSHALAGEPVVDTAELGRRLGGRSARQIYDDRKAGMPAFRLGQGRGEWRYALNACLRWHGIPVPADPSTGGDHTSDRRSA